MRSTVDPRLRTTTKNGAIRFEARVKPNARTTAVREVRDGVLRVDVAAPARDGAANDELVRIIAKTLGIAKSNVSIVNGAGSRSKVIEAMGATEQAIVTRLVGP